MDLRAEGVDHLWRQDRLLGAALWGASDLEYREDGTAERRILEEGVQAGTFMTPEGGRFSFQVTAQEVTPSSTRLLVRIENYDTGEVRLYEGDLARRGLRGELYDLSAGRKAARRLPWDLREPRRSR